MRLHDIVFHRDPLAAPSQTFRSSSGPPYVLDPLTAGSYPALQFGSRYPVPTAGPSPRHFTSGGSFPPSPASFFPVSLYDLLTLLGSLRSNIPTATMARLVFRVSPAEYSNLRLWLYNGPYNLFDASNRVDQDGTITVMGVTILPIG